MRISRDTVILLGLTLATAELAGAMAISGLTTPLEAAGVVTGAVCVWLTVKENVWNFPISLLNVTVCSILYFSTQLYADASLQVIYFVLTIIGWYWWLHGGKNRSALRVARAGMTERVSVGLAVAVMTAAYWWILQRIGGTVTFWDALTTSLCLGAQWLLNRKRLENWVLWITADVIYVPLLMYKGLYLMAALYAVFLVMATMGLREWLATYRKQRGEGIEQAVPAEVPA